MKPADHAVSVSLTYTNWIMLLGYLSGVGCGEELEAYRWIHQQVMLKMKEPGDDK